MILWNIGELLLSWKLACVTIGNLTIDVANGYSDISRQQKAKSFKKKKIELNKFYVPVEQRWRATN
jgi:hypothetical protein